MAVTTFIDSRDSESESNFLAFADYRKSQYCFKVLKNMLLESRSTSSSNDILKNKIMTQVSSDQPSSSADSSTRVKKLESQIAHRDNEIRK